MFRAVYLGLFFNVLAMSGVALAAIKIGEVMLNLDPLTTIGAAALVTMVFSALGGLRGVIYTDFILFFVAMIGAIAACVVALNHPDVGGLDALLKHENVSGKIDLIPSTDNWELFITIITQRDT